MLSLSAVSTTFTTGYTFTCPPAYMVGVARKVQVEVGFEPENLDAIESEAEQLGISRAAYIREATRERLQIAEGEQ